MLTVLSFIQLHLTTITKGYLDAVCDCGMFSLMCISGITYESISSCNSLLDYLVGRLKKQSPYVKYKVTHIAVVIKKLHHSCLSFHS